MSRITRTGAAGLSVVYNSGIGASSTRKGPADLNKTTTLKNVAASLTAHLSVGARVEGEGIPVDTLIKEVKPTEVVLTKAATITKAAVELTFLETDAIEHSKIVGGGGAVTVGGVFGLIQSAGRGGGQTVCGGLASTSVGGLTLRNYPAGPATITLGIGGKITVNTFTGQVFEVNGAFTVSAAGASTFTGEVTFLKVVGTKSRADEWNALVTSVGAALLGTVSLNTASGTNIRFTSIAEPTYSIGGIKVEPAAKDGLIGRIYNATTKNLVLKHEAAEVETEAGFFEAVAEENRINCTSGADLVLTQGQCAVLQWDNKLNRWRAWPENLALRIERPTAIGAYTSAKEETEVKGTFITLVITVKAEAAAATVKLVNSGEEISFKWDGVALGVQRVPLQFMVKKGGTWKATLEGAAEKAEISRVTIEP